MTGHQRKYSLVPRDVARVETEHRRIVTRLPVPESVPIFERLERFEPSSMQGQPPIVIDRAEGWHVHDRWGNMWLDWSSGVLISNIGNSAPVIIDALKEMLYRPLLSTYVFAHEKRAELAELLVGVAPSPDYKVFLLSTGSEATENCIKLAKTYGLQKHGPERRCFVSFQNAFHGRTMGAQLAGGSANQKKWMGRLDDSFVQVPFPDGYKNTDTRFELFLETLEKKGISPRQICGVMSESFQGAGPDFMPVEYARSLEAWCRENDILLIMDEVQAGFGRTGTWFAFQNYGIVPDLICCGKGISSSLALSAVIGRTDVMELYPPGSMTSTHSGSPLPVAAAVANIKELKKGAYLQNARALDSMLRDGLLEIQAKHPEQAGCVHSKGLVAGIQIVKPGTKEPDPVAALAINEACFHRGLLMFAPVGVGGECIKIAPALDISREALAEGLGVLGEAMDEALQMSTPLLSRIDQIHEGTTHRVKDKEKAILYREICVGTLPTRLTLSRRLAMRPSSVSAAVQELVDDGLVLEEQSQANGKTGRPQSVLSARPDRFVAISVYVDSRELKGVLVTLREEVLAESVRVLSQEAGNKELAKAIHDLLAELALHVPDGCKLVGACLALVGTVNVRTRTWVSAARWPKLRDLDVARIAARVSFPVVLRRTNEAELDYYLDSTPAARGGTMLLLHWGFGIGSAVSFRGALLGSTIGRFGEIGHAHIEGDAKALCLCGQTGCLETVAALWALVPVIRKKLGHEVPEDEKELAPILAEARILALPEVERAIHALQGALRVLTMLFYPDTILFSGPFTDNRRVFRRLDEGLRGSLPDYVRQSLSLDVIPGGMPGCRRGGGNPLFREALAPALRRKT